MEAKAAKAVPSARQSTTFAAFAGVVLLFVEKCRPAPLDTYGSGVEYSIQFAVD